MDDAPVSLPPAAARPHDSWRPDVEGLRGVAAILVVLYHSRMGVFHGGFTGVDIFFVVSGFVITRQVVLALDRGHFSLEWFLHRRVRRLLPAATLMVAVTLFIGNLVLLPTDLVNLADSAIAVLAWVGNLYFWRQHSYFADSGPELPLLHMWSLGVEAQFYLLFPFLLLAVLRWSPRHAVSLVGAVAATSLALSIWGTHQHPGASFYQLPTRLWEFLVGALIVLRGQDAAVSSRVRKGLAFLGAAAMLVGAICLSPQTPYPGIAAVLPVLATALVLSFAPGTPVGRLLSLPKIVAIGAASYSLYLWHWPVLVLMRYRFGADPGPVLVAFAFLAIALLTYLSWRFIETPYRDSAPLGRSYRMSVVLFAAVACAVVSVLLIGLDGRPGRIPPAALVLDAQRTLHGSGDDHCHAGPPQVVSIDELCRSDSAGAVRDRVLVWGDSHAHAIVPVLSAMAAEHGKELWQATYSSCPPLLGVDVARMAGSHHCREFNDMVLRAVRQFDIRSVVLSSYWSAYLWDPALNPVDRWLDPYSSRDALGSGHAAANRRNFENALARTVAALQAAGAEVLVLREVPTQQEFVPVALARAVIDGQDVSRVATTLAKHVARSGPADSIVSRSVTPDRLMDPAAVLCSAGRCPASLDGQSLYIDAHHLSAAGAGMLRAGLEAAFK
ncbi:MAG: acyltransferase [Proteobacteria bacterium]|nr:acyltransferase [Pseudomonadota bacterium]MBP7013260.1 acyltransferase [Steroidobacteraceae bacterium]